MATTRVTRDNDPAYLSHVQWPAILAGSFAGFATTIIMATLGAAIGVTAGAAALDSGTGGGGRISGEGSALGVGIGVGIGVAVWMAITALVAGFVGGAIMNRTARHDRPYLPLSFGTVTWAFGVFLALIVASSGLTGAIGAAGGGAAGSALGRQPNGITRLSDVLQQPSTGRAPQNTPSLGDVNTQIAAEQAAKAAAAFAWVLLATQLIGLVATWLAARWRRPREIPVYAGRGI